MPAQGGRRLVEPLGIVAQLVEFGPGKETDGIGSGLAQGLEQAH